MTQNQVELKLRSALHHGTYKVVGRRTISVNGEKRERCNILVPDKDKSFHIVIETQVGRIPTDQKPLKIIDFPITFFNQPGTQPPKEATMSKQTAKTIKSTHKTGTQVVDTKHFIDIVIGVRYIFDPENGPTRDVKVAKVWSHDDLSNEPEKRLNEIIRCEHKLNEMGYFTFESDAFEDAAKTASRVLAELAHDLRYGDKDKCVCKNCTANILTAVEEFLNFARNHWNLHNEKVADIMDSPDGDKCEIGVFPNDSDETEYVYGESDGRLHLKNPPDTVKTELKVIDTKDLPKDVRENLEKLISAIKDGSAQNDPEKKNEKHEKVSPCEEPEYALHFNQKLAGKADELTPKITTVLDKYRIEEQVYLDSLTAGVKADIIGEVRGATGIKNITLTFKPDIDAPFNVRILVGLTSKK